MSVCDNVEELELLDGILEKYEVLGFKLAFFEAADRAGDGVLTEVV